MLASLFENPEDYSFWLSPLIVRPRRGLARVPFSTRRDATRWKQSQKRFLKWACDPSIRNEEEIARDAVLRAEIVGELGWLEGNTLDVGGGWGFYRQWWNGNDGDVYIVHDLLLSRFVASPMPAYQDVYREALSKPMTFVEGFGEHLPYRASSFKTGIVAETLRRALRCDPPALFAS